MKVLQSFTHEEIAGNVVDERLESHFSESLRMAKLQSLFSSLGQTLPEIAKLLVMGHVFFPLRRAASMTTEIGTSVGSMDRILEFFDAQPSVTEAKEAIVLPKVEGLVQYGDVSFSYSQNGTERVLRDISFEVQPGSFVAFVGPSGAGKSTMMDLLSRFYDPVEGRICIDGVDIRTMSLEYLRKNIGIVMQDTILFSGTIAENVRLGNPDASDPEVHEALANAYALEFVEKMQYGMNSSIAEQGKTLSGGQRQRIALARMFLKNPRIIILDEATSALDTESEQYVQQALQGLRTGRTTLMIAHQFTTLKDVEYIFVVEQGRIVEEGSMNDLLMAKGVFHRLYESQSRMLAVEDTYQA
jgi:ABC-type multidrug transport system fused ATPase/permease subunit